MATGSKVRVYDLAKELKQDTKRIIEELRREGADIDVPSNSVSKELADKIRGKYFPKLDAAPKRAIKIIKKVSTSAEDDTPVQTELSVEFTETPIVEEIPRIIEQVVEKPVAVTEPTIDETAAPKTTVREIKLKKPEAVDEILPIIEVKVEPVVQPNKVEVAEPVKVEVTEVAKPVEVVTNVQVAEVPKVETPQVSPPTSSVKILAPKVIKPIGTSVRQLKLTPEALKKGFKTGEKVITVTNQPTKTGKFEEKPKEVVRPRNDRGGRGKTEFRGTPGETATPQMAYTPPTDGRKKFGRNQGKKGIDKNAIRDNKFAERDINAPRHRSIEERIIDQIGKTASQESKFARLVEGATVRDFAEKIGVTPRDIVQLLVKKGIFATLNQPIGEKMAIDLGKNFGYDVSFIPFEEMMVENEFEELIAADSDDVEEIRPPVVTVMGHVDHGKTSLLDGIRSANVAEGEAGGITQHIGAYSVFVNNPDNPGEKRRVVFLDTPGHEAFTLMRARGAKATDLVILVVAADDGVMPQTIEAIEHSKAAGVPIIVAINKIDKPDANTDKVKQGLAVHGLQPLDWGGDIEMIPVSAKKRQNIDNLLETVLLQADIMDLKASPTRRASGVVLEAKLDKGRGSVATVLVQQGTLRVGDPFIVGQIHGKVRAMFSDRGDLLTEAPPATPVEVLGLQGVPQAGDSFQVVADIDQAVSIAGQRQMQARQRAMLKTTKRGLESLGLAEFKELLVILKADVQGSVEVLKATLEKLSTEKVKVRVIRAGVGAIAESDVLLASATQTDNASTAVVIIGFNVRPESRASETAKQEEVDIRLHSIIYKVEEEITAAMIGMLDKIQKETILGKALVLDTFKVTKIGTVAGCRVTDGVIKRQAKARIIRGGVVAWEGDIDSLKRFKEDAAEVRQGFECGIGLVNFNDIKVDDEIEAFMIESIAATEL
jgi:translation initiation factor IF-2